MWIITEKVPRPLTEFMTLFLWYLYRLRVRKAPQQSITNHEGALPKIEERMEISMPLWIIRQTPSHQTMREYPSGTLTRNVWKIHWIRRRTGKPKTLLGGRGKGMIDVNNWSLKWLNVLGDYGVEASAIPIFGIQNVINKGFKIHVWENCRASSSLLPDVELIVAPISPIPRLELYIKVSLTCGTLRLRNVKFCIIY